MAKSKPQPKPKKPAVTDVAHPNTSAPPDTSKPIITSRPIIKDPMVVEDEADAELPGQSAPDEAKSLPLKKAGETKIKPLSEKPEKAEPQPEPAKTEPASQTNDTAGPEKSAEETEEETGAAAEKGSDETPGNKSEKAEDEAEAEAQAAEEAKVRKLVDSRKYFLPINAVEHRRSARFAAVGIILALLLVVAWVDVALDAGLIHLGGVKPVTHLFSN